MRVVLYTFADATRAYARGERVNSANCCQLYTLMQLAHTREVREKCVL
mgnify:CR=1 FL=1